jgi:hypothetical protein
MTIETHGHKPTKKYQPNFNDPRVLNRVRHAYGFTRAVMSETKPSNWSQSAIDRYLGLHSNKLSRYLRGLLLICTDDRYSITAGVTKQYLVNPRGVRYLREQLQRTTSLTYSEWCKQCSSKEDNSHPNTSPCSLHLQQEPLNHFDQLVVDEWCKREFGQELNQLTFTYEDKSGRLWHPIQNVRRAQKTKLLSNAGLKHQYDISSCAPTLILQHAQALGMDEYLFAINRYIKDKDTCRQQLAELADIPVKTAKVLVNALFCGARLGNSTQFALSALLNHDAARIMVLQEDEFVNELKSDIKKCWTAIEKTMPQTYALCESTGKQRKKPINSKQKWNKYFELERRVLDTVVAYLNATENKHFCEHDGWTCERAVDVDELGEYVRERTGFNISLNYESEEDNSHPNTSPCSLHLQIG